MSVYLERCSKKQPTKPSETPQQGIPDPWKSTIQHLIQGPLSKTDIYSCLAFNERPQSWIFFVVGGLDNLPNVVNLEIYRHVVFAIMLEHWVVVHVDLVTLNAAYLDPKSSDTSTAPNDLKELLVRWLTEHLSDDSLGQKLKLFEKECEQHNDTAMLAISNIYALARGYACSGETDPFRLRSDLIRKMKAIRDSNKPSRRLNQWTTIYGLRTADSIFDFGMPPPYSPKGDATVSKEPSSSSPSYLLLHSAAAPSKKRAPSTPARPVAPSELRNPFGPSPPMAPSKKRKAEASSTVTNVPAKRRQVAEPPKEDTSSWFFSTWWGKKQDLDVARESMEKLQGELEKAKANVHDIKREMRVLEKRK